PKPHRRQLQRLARRRGATGLLPGRGV
ncbi:MAG: hypothetical protein AVDCRST_MAG73-1735, partial [uncultured Thermomicrobiales bacterium]